MYFLLVQISFYFIMFINAKGYNTIFYVKIVLQNNKPFVLFVPRFQSWTLFKIAI